jgi:hypothetical protein
MRSLGILLSFHVRGEGGVLLFRWGFRALMVWIINKLARERGEGVVAVAGCHSIS